MIAIGAAVSLIAGTAYLATGNQSEPAALPARSNPGNYLPDVSTGEIEEMFQGLNIVDPDVYSVRDPLQRAIALSRHSNLVENDARRKRQVKNDAALAAGLGHSDDHARRKQQVDRDAELARRLDQPEQSPRSRRRSPRSRPVEYTDPVWYLRPRILGRTYDRRYERIKTPADNNCLFHAIGAQVGEDHLEVRRQICDEIARDEDGLLSTLLNSTAKDLKDLRDRYKDNLAKIRSEGVWGGDFEIAAAKILWPRGFVVYQNRRPFAKQDHLAVSATSQVYSGEPIYLHRVNGTHWEAMRPASG